MNRRIVTLASLVLVVPACVTPLGRQNDYHGEAESAPDDTMTVILEDSASTATLSGLPRACSTAGTEGISAQLLEWKGIEATEKLAMSPNTKVVVVGNPKNGLPLILGGGAEK